MIGNLVVIAMEGLKSGPSREGTLESLVLFGVFAMVFGIVWHRLFFHAQPVNFHARSSVLAVRRDAAGEPAPFATLLRREET